MSDSSNPGGPPIETTTDSEVENPEISVAANTPFHPLESASQIAGEIVPVVGESVGDFPSEQPELQIDRSTGRSAFFVGAGILISRIVGLIRQRVFAHYFGTSAAGDAFSAAFRIPNFLQNVFGEGALSASFIPVYAKLLAQKDEKQSQHTANAIFGVLALVTSLAVLSGVLAAPYLVTVIAPGFIDERRELTIRLVQIFFPGAGLLVLSAWCLGVLNSHHRFFISYTAPVAWNLAIITALIVFGARVDQFRLAEITAWGSVIGSALQFAVQLPTVLRLVQRFRPIIDMASVHVRTVVRSFFPVFISRGVVQISAFVDEAIASFLGHGAVVALNYAQSLYTLPVSLFGMAVSAAELPAMSRAVGSSELVFQTLRTRLNAGLRRIAFFIVPSAMAFLALGDVIAGALYQTGRFGRTDAVYVWAILAGSTVGLLGATLGRLYSSTYYALQDTRTPLKFAIIHVSLSTVLGYFSAIHLPPALNIDPKWGVAFLTASAGVAAFIEFSLLRRRLNSRIGSTGLEFAYVAVLWLSAAAGAAIGWALKLLLAGLHPIPLAALVLGAYGVSYFAITSAAGLEESRTVIGRVLKILRIGRI
jgi:putative peptidoglycan lipid II flippase